jgi:hypothetical protein
MCHEAKIIINTEYFMPMRYFVLSIKHTALSGVMSYTIGGQDAHPTRVS